MKVLVTLSLSLGSIAGCASGDYRVISFSSDMTPGDLAHYRAKAGASKKESIEDFIGGMPFLFLPLILVREECVADKTPENEFHYHFENTFLFLLFVARSVTVANFDPNGKNLSYDSRRSLLLGLFASESGRRLLKDNTYAPTSAFSLLWGLFATERTVTGRSWRFFWIPIV
jgi:hypothetical protein